MKCGACDRPFNDREQIPLNLSCGHTFCRSCLKSWARAGGTIECRSCFKKCPRRIQELSKNFIALSAGCEYRDNLQRFRPCTKHPIEYSRFFCEDCDVLFCPMCVVDHPGHSFSEVKFSLDAILRKVAVLREALTRRTRTVLEAKERIEAQSRLLEQNATEELKAIDAGTARMTEIIRSAFDRFSADLRAKFSRQEHLFEKNVERVLILETEVAQLNRELESLGNALEAVPQKPLKIKSIFERAGAQRQLICELKRKESFNPSLTVYRFTARREVYHNSFAYISKIREEPVLCFLSDERVGLLYRPLVDNWEILAIPEPGLDILPGMRGVFVSTAEMLITGGGANFVSVYLFNLKTLAITPRRPMLYQRAHHCLIAVKGRVFAVGGYSSQEGACTLKCEVYEVASDKWLSIADMSHRRQNFGCVALSDDRLLVCGGLEPAKQNSAIEIYDILADSWTTLSVQLPGGLMRCRCFGGTQMLNVFGHSAFHGRLEGYNVEIDKLSIRKLSGIGKHSSFAHCHLSDDGLLLFGGKDANARKISLSDKQQLTIAGYRHLANTDLSKWICVFGSAFSFESVLFGRRTPRGRTKPPPNAGQPPKPTARPPRLIYPFSVHSDSLVGDEELFPQDSLAEEHLLYNPLNSGMLGSDFDDLDES